MGRVRIALRHAVAVQGAGQSTAGRGHQRRFIGETGIHEGLLFGQGVGKDVEEEGILACEVRVQRSLAHARLRGDVAEGRGIVAVLRKVHDGDGTDVIGRSRAFFHHWGECE